MPDKLPQPVEQLLDATNAGNIDAFLAGFTADGVVDDWGREFRGPAAIRQWSDNEFLGKQVTLEVTGSTSDGAETTVVTQVGGNGFNGPSTFVFTTAGDKVSRMTIRA
ncbi:nuclear transport factor 2 family protein [Nocardia brasiliensis]|uniref:Nuclear transport factor 2 family protein n=1 Tax=Nocardia brasiliensis TaxID=37326 RepID=A0A6G9XQX7_NOCBR|nr:nuclear transport factor 2 family protein [Nocardia brasiliensis]QIS03352.1 nuclear transport factor 2 family protein [Nocardia brasiliensis]